MNVADDVRRIFGDVEDLAERLREDRATPSLEPLGVDQDPVAMATRRERSRLLGAGIAGLDKIRKGRDDELDDRERLGLTAIILLHGRPAILVKDGDFAAPPPEWSQLSRHRDGIRDVIARSGRIEVDGHLDYHWLGTAFLVAHDTVMTNRHVASELCASKGDTWSFHAGLAARVDFRVEHERSEPLEFAVTEPIGLHADHDLALLRVEVTSAAGEQLPAPLALAAAAPADLFERDVYVVGHPALDSRRNEPEPIRRLFEGIFDVKRLQPGRTVGWSTAFGAVEHDCSTLGGNSGSPLVDLETHRVLGLHFGGRYGIGNYAVPLWTLRGDPLLEASGLSFA